MAAVDEVGVCALVFEFLSKKDKSLAHLFQQKTKAVSSAFPHHPTSLPRVVDDATAWVCFFQ